jgi:hypothetical protein
MSAVKKAEPFDMKLTGVKPDSVTTKLRVLPPIGELPPEPHPVHSIAYGKLPKPS